MNKIIISIIIAIVLFTTMANADTAITAPEKQLEINQFREARETTKGSIWIIATKAQNKAFYNPGEEFKEKTKKNIGFEKLDFFHHRFLQEVTLVKWDGIKFNYRTEQKYSEKKLAIDKIILIIAAFFSLILFILFILCKKGKFNNNIIITILFCFTFCIVLASMFSSYYISGPITFSGFITSYTGLFYVVKVFASASILSIFLFRDHENLQNFSILSYAIFLIVAIII